MRAERVKTKVEDEEEYHYKYRSLPLISIKCCGTSVLEWLQRSQATQAFTTAPRLDC